MIIMNPSSSISNSTATTTTTTTSRSRGGISSSSRSNLVVVAVAPKEQQEHQQTQQLSTTNNNSSSTTTNNNANNNNNNTATQSSTSSVVVGGVANPVVIIHQNQSISTNLVVASSASSSSSSSSATSTISTSNNNNSTSRTINNNTSNSNNSVNNNNVVGNSGSAQNQAAVDEMMTELKYMKGYVNVLKERFTRKSLDPDHQPALQTSASTTNATSSARFTNDYGRRRSVSPFIYGTHTSTHQSVKSKFANAQQQQHQHSNIVTHVQNQLKERKLFASSDDLRHSHPHPHNYRPIVHTYLNQLQHHYNHDVTTTTRAAVGGGFSSSRNDLTIDQAAIVKCTYSNEINKDELPRPNFVSSVKNLFEKQLTSCSGMISNNLSKSASASSHPPPPTSQPLQAATVVAPQAHNSRYYHSSNSSLGQNVNASCASSQHQHNYNPHHYHHHHSQQQHHHQGQQQQQQLDMLDRLKNNCTVVYDHSNNGINGGATPSNASITAAVSSTATISHQNVSNVVESSSTSTIQHNQMNGHHHNHHNHSSNSTKTLTNGYHHDDLTTTKPETNIPHHDTTSTTKTTHNNNLANLTNKSLNKSNKPTTTTTTSAAVIIEAVTATTTVGNKKQQQATIEATVAIVAVDDKENKEQDLSSASSTSSSSSTTTEPTTTTSSSTSTTASAANRVLTFKERKEIFSKKQQQISNGTTNNNSLNSVKQAPEVQQKQQTKQQIANQTVKRIKIEEPTSNVVENKREQEKLQNGVRSSATKSPAPKKTFTNGSKNKPMAPIANNNNNTYVAQSINSIYNTTNNSTPKTMNQLPTTTVQIVEATQTQLNTDNNNNNTTMKKPETTTTTEEDTNTQQQQQDQLVSDSTAEMSADRIFEQSQTQKAKLKAKSAVKMKTFFGGEEIKSIEQINPSHLQPPPLPQQQPPSLNKSNSSSSSSSSFSSSSSSSQVHLNNSTNHQTNGGGGNSSSSSSLDYFNFEFVGAGIKLEKSILIVNSQSSNPNITFGDDARRGSRNKNGTNLRVNFTDVAETYEYPSYEFLLKEMGIVDGDGEDENGVSTDYPYESSTEDSLTSQTLTPNNHITASTTSFTQFLPGRSNRQQTTTDDDDEDENEENDDEDNYPESSHYNQIGETGGSYTVNGGSGTSPSSRNGYHRRRGEDGTDDQEDATGFYENFSPDGIIVAGVGGSPSKTDNKFSKLGTFTNFKPSWHTMSYELGTVLENGHHQINGSNSKQTQNGVNGSETAVMTRDILPSKDDEVKRWSSEMDSNILF